jgi:hypothetical protein
LKIWISQDYGSGEYFMTDSVPNYKSTVGPLEISYELHEHIRAVEAAFDAAQDVLATLVYEWKTGDQVEIDCA